MKEERREAWKVVGDNFSHQHEHAVMYRRWKTHWIHGSSMMELTERHGCHQEAELYECVDLLRSSSCMHSKHYLPDEHVKLLVGEESRVCGLGYSLTR